MTTATTFSRQNYAAPRASTTEYWENLVLVFVLVLESKGRYYRSVFPPKSTKLVWQQRRVQQCWIAFDWHFVCLIDLICSASRFLARCKRAKSFVHYMTNPRDSKGLCEKLRAKLLSVFNHYQKHRCYIRGGFVTYEITVFKFSSNNTDSYINITTFFNLPDMFWRYILIFSVTYCVIAVEFKSRALLQSSLHRVGNIVLKSLN